MKKAYPDVKIVYNTRLPKPSNISYYQIYTGHLYEDWVDELTFHPQKWWQKTPIPIPSVHRQDELYKTLKDHTYSMTKDTLEIKSTSLFAVSLICYLQNKAFVDHLLIYDEWMKDVQAETEKLFESLNVPKDYVQLALTAMKRDSQDNYFVNSSRDKKNVFTEDQVRRINCIYKVLDLPLKYEMKLEEFKTFLTEYTF